MSCCCLIVLLINARTWAHWSQIAVQQVTSFLASRSVKSVTKTWRGSCANEKEPNSSMSPPQVLLAVSGWCYVLIFVGYLARRSQEAVGWEMLRGLICSGVNRHGTCRTCPPFQESDLRFLIDDLHNFRILADLGYLSRAVSSNWFLGFKSFSHEPRCDAAEPACYCISSLSTRGRGTKHPVRCPLLSCVLRASEKVQRAKGEPKDCCCAVCVHLSSL